VKSTSFARIVISGSAVIAAASIGISAFARPPYPAILKQVYPKAAGLSCNACHDGAPPKLNKYGTSVKGVLDKSKTPKVLTVAEIKSLDMKGIRPVGATKAPPTTK
jgi:hypothetical protein